ncbi:MAG: energy transducer TonB [Burkholderiales bacterium]|nr:energy transducer TonB [Burkholderiales bacterium]
MTKFAVLAAAALAVGFPMALHGAVSDVKPGKLVPNHRVDPEFPRLALKTGVERGLVTARLTLDADGKVTQVDIVQAEPRRIFDQAVLQALSQWRYSEGRAGRVVEVEVSFANK